MITKTLQRIANTKTMNKLEDWAIKEKSINYTNMQKFYPTAFMFAGGIVQAGFLYKSKDMPKERKIPLILNIANTMIISLIGGAILNKPIDKLLKNTLKRAEVLYKNPKTKAILINGIKTAVPFLVPALMFKYVGAVLATPLADKENKFFVKKGWIDYSNP